MIQAWFPQGPPSRLETAGLESWPRLQAGRKVRVLGEQAAGIPPFAPFPARQVQALATLGLNF